MMRTRSLLVVGLAVVTGSTLTGCEKPADQAGPVTEVAVSDVDVDVDEAVESEMVFVEPDSALIQEIIRTASSIGEVVFPHYMHVDDIGMECAECHHEVNATKLDIPHESYFEDFWIDCETCHGNHAEPTGAALSCSKCHPSRPRTLSDQSLSSKVVIHKNCWDCHDVGRGADASGECALCHSGPKRPMDVPR